MQQTNTWVILVLAESVTASPFLVSIRRMLILSQTVTSGRCTPYNKYQLNKQWQNENSCFCCGNAKFGLCTGLQLR